MLLIVDPANLSSSFDEEGSAAMTIVAHDQSKIGSEKEGSVACGASCIMCASTELGLSTEFTNQLGKRIYDTIKKGENSESDMSGVVKYCKDNNFKCTIIIDQEHVDTLVKSDEGIENLYNDFQKDIVKAKLDIETRTAAPAFSDADFDHEARLMLVVMFFENKKPKTHWVLARKHEGHIHVMNPDGGVNSRHKDFLTWMNPKNYGEKRVIQGAREIEGASEKEKTDNEYLFTGIVLRLTT